MKRGVSKCAYETIPLHSAVRRIGHTVVGNDPAPPVKLGDGDFADRVIVALHGLREYLDHPYRRLLDVLHEMPGIVSEMGLSTAELPDFTTVCTRKEDLEMAVWRVLLCLSAALHDLGEVQAIDSTSYAYRSSSRNYAKRVEGTFESVKIIPLVDWAWRNPRHPLFEESPHETQIGWQVLTRNLDLLERVTADKGFDGGLPCQKLREAGIGPGIKHREFYGLDVAHNARIDDRTYHRRSIVKSTFLALHNRFGSTIRSRTWFGQFREIILKLAVRSTELTINHSDQ